MKMGKKIFEAWNSQVLLKMLKKCELSSAVDTNVKNNNNSNSWETICCYSIKLSVCLPYDPFLIILAIQTSLSHRCSERHVLMP